MLYLESMLIKIAALRAENADLKEKLSVDSKNFSKPPSADFKKHKKLKNEIKKKSGKKQGAQPGHKGVSRQLESIDKVNNIIDCKPSSYCICSGDIIYNTNYSKHQVYDIDNKNSLFLVFIYEVLEAGLAFYF